MPYYRSFVSLRFDIVAIASRQSAKLSLQSSELGLPYPLTRRRVCVYPPPPFGSGGEDTLSFGRGAGGRGGPNSNEGTDTGTLALYSLCASDTL